jgi:hypothetical protein
MVTNTEALNLAAKDQLADHMRQLALGFILRGQIPQVLRRRDPAASSYNLATLEAIALPATAKAASIIRATSIAGTVTGELTPQVYGTTPATTQIAVAPNGDIVVLAADAITSLDITYLPERGDVYEVTLPVASNVLTIPTAVSGSAQGVVLLAECEAMVGTSTGKKIVLVPGAGAPAAGQCRLNIAKTTVTFPAADAVTSARIKLVLCAAVNLDTLLEAQSTIL